MANRNAITNDAPIRPVKSNTISFERTFTRSVDKYNRTKTINLLNPALELLNVKFRLAKKAKTVPREKLIPLER